MVTLESERTEVVECSAHLGVSALIFLQEVRDFTIYLSHKVLTLVLNLSGSNGSVGLMVDHFPSHGAQVEVLSIRACSEASQCALAGADPNLCLVPLSPRPPTAAMQWS